MSLARIILVQSCVFATYHHRTTPIATDYASTAGNLPRRADTFAQPKSTVLAGDEPPKVSVSSVAAVTRRLLAVPATTVASERVFSKARNVITKK